MGCVQQFQQENGPLITKQQSTLIEYNDDDDDDNIVRQDRDRSGQHIRNCL